MPKLFPQPPIIGTPLAPSRANSKMRAALALRRSAGKNTLDAPGPEGDTLNEILQIALRVPDHRRVEPWRFIVFEGDRRAAFGAQLARIHAEEENNLTPKELDADRQLLLRAPTVVAVISSLDPQHKTPVWEQQLSAGAVCQTLLLAASASGFAGVWLTEWISYSTGVARTLGLGEHERVAGFIYLGTARAAPPERPRPDLSQHVTHWQDEPAYPRPR